jgi:hypothetical protein
MPKAGPSIPYLLALADELHREVEFAPDTKYVVTVRRELMARIEAALRGLAIAPSKIVRAWTVITTERTRRQREQLAGEISRIQNETLRTQLRHTLSRLMMFIEDDLEQWIARGGRP